MGRRSSRGPFERLGELKRGRPADQTASTGDSTPSPEPSAAVQTDDTTLFRDAVRDARPLQAAARVERRPSAASDSRRVPRDAVAAPPPRRVASGAPALSEFDADAHAKPGVGPDVLRKLRRLGWTVEAELSVRGMTQEEAWAALRTFLSECSAHGARCVRVIHGKGMQSPGRMPVLKGRVRAWLAQDANVRAFTEAPPAAGGTGALIVLLKVGPGP